MPVAQGGTPAGQGEVASAVQCLLKSAAAAAHGPEAAQMTLDSHALELWTHGTPAFDQGPFGTRWTPMDPKLIGHFLLIFKLDLKLILKF